ncbi:MAG: efflux RND transporter periplasmic adaptor subunit [Gammaproteobacteria bacterium]|nr:efflux RND transporter periplasmic adaptor subunit [Gammaproteobacteria bacterium]
MKNHVLAILLATLVVLSGLGCDQSDSDDAKHAENSAAAAFCEEHQITEAQCPFCDPSLIISLGFCNGHGVPEAFCYKCNPDLIPAFKAVRDWCAGHDRPESQCYICNPQLDPARNETPATETSDATTPASRVYVSRTQQPPSVSCSKQNTIVSFDSPEIADQAGFEITTIESRPITETVECNAEVVYDGNRYAQISAQVPGIVAKVHKNIGDTIEPREALVTITSTQLGAAKASYLQATAAVALWKRNHEREENLLDRGVSTEKDLLEAETRLAESLISLSQAEQVLLSFRLSKKEIEEVGRSDDTSTQYVIRAPFSGIVVERFAVNGEVVEPSKPLFAVADVSRMWALIDVYESNMRHVQVGQPVVLHVDGLPGEAFAGHITWVSAQLNPKTRTLQVRADLDNTGGLLRAHMFAQASVSVRERQKSLVVPKASVQWEGCCNVVFVKTSETVYEPRKVNLGIATGTVYEVISGVEEGEEVVTQGSFLLKTEILKGSIGAGCCEVDPGA